MCESGAAHHACSEGGWMCQIPARVRSFSGGGRSDVCPRAKVALSISLGGHGVCRYVQGWTGARTFRGSKYPGCNSEAWHQGEYVVQDVRIACSGV
jgi:hypothetical protein